MNEFTQKDVEILTGVVARMLGVRKKLKQVRFKKGPEGSPAFCFPEVGLIEFPDWIVTKTVPANTIHFAIHEVVHLRHPKLLHMHPKFRKTEEMTNKKFGIRVLFDRDYAVSLYDLDGNLLWSRKTQTIKALQKKCIPLKVDWKKVARGV